MSPPLLERKILSRENRDDLPLRDAGKLVYSPAMTLFKPHLLSFLLCQGSALALLIGASSAFAQQNQEQTLEEIEKALESDAERAAEIQNARERDESESQHLSEEAVVLAREAQDLESELNDIELTMGVLHAEVDRKRYQLRGSREQLIAILSALERIAALPPEALLLNSDDPLDQVRGGILLSATVPELKRRADVLQGELASLSSLTEEIESKQRELADKSHALAEKKKALGDLLMEKSDRIALSLREEAELEARQRQLARKAEDLRGLLAELEETRKREEEALEQAQAEAQAGAQAQTESEQLAALVPPPRPAAPTGSENREAPGQSAAEERASLQPSPPPNPPPSPPAQRSTEKPDNLRPFPKEQASLVLPVRGRRLLGYGEKAEDGQATSRGLTFEARPGGQVVAPFDGKIVYAGPFRSYGLILIIEHDERYHSLLAGFDRLQAGVGQWVLAGEPVGVMASSGDFRPRLYLELRRSGQPIDPLPWLATNEKRAQG